MVAHVQSKTSAPRATESNNSEHNLPQKYQQWLIEEVPYIITNEEGAAFKKLTTDEEREAFIEIFWERRNPKPGSAENEFRIEHYRRIAFVNAHYAGSFPGWKTDRGRTYIMYGPPGEIDSHPAHGHANFAKPTEF